jgi:hypothetical protein
MDSRTLQAALAWFESVDIGGQPPKDPNDDEGVVMNERTTVAVHSLKRKTIFQNWKCRDLRPDAIPISLLFT